MEVTWTRKILSIPPIWITLAFGAWFGSAFLLPLSDFGPAFWLSMLVFVAPVVAWHCSLYVEARRAQSKAPGLAVLFLVPVIGSVVAMYLPIEFDALAVIPTNTFFFVGVWCAARALVGYETGAGTTPRFRRTVWTFLLLFYLPIGVWIVNPRIKKMLCHDERASVF